MAYINSGVAIGTRGGLATNVLTGSIASTTSATKTGDSEFIKNPSPLYAFGTPVLPNEPRIKTTSGSYNATTALASTGVFAYGPTKNEWTILGVGTKINGTLTTQLGTGSSQLVSKRNRRQKMFGAKTSTAFRAGYFQPLGTDNRTPWTTKPASLNESYISPTGGAVDDQAIYHTYLTIPGEFTYMYGAPNPKQDEYSGRYGA